MAKSYDQLTNRGRARRLRRIALSALECYALKVARVRLITNGFNCIFRVDTANGEKYILRIALPEGGHSYEQYCSEMMWLAALSQDTDLSIPEPMPSKKGELFVEVEAEGVPEPRFCMIFSWVSGTDLALQLTPANVEKQGCLMANLHIHAATFQPPRGFDIYTFDTTFPFPEPVVLLEDRFTDVIPAKRRRLFEEAVKWSENTIADLQSSGEPIRVLHSDLHQWNVRVARGVLSPIDFEDMLWGWPVQDIGIALYYYLGQDNYPDLRDAFQHGYQTIAVWPEKKPGQVDAFIAARALMLMNFLLGTIDPHWQEMVPDYARRTEKRIRMLMN